MNKQQVHADTERLERTVHDAVKHLSQLGDKSLVGPFLELSDRLKDDRHFVAVFGAFSAGKSSLINAVLGQQALAVSPHPTTAVITEVEVSSTGDSNKTVKVWTKTRDEVWEDVSRALRYLHMHAEDLEDGIKKALRLKAVDFPSGSRRHVSFLRAVSEGYERMSSKLGQVLTYPLEELETLTADESVACYLHRVQMQSSVQSMNDGIVLVDTPGVDSIHRRHTDVAFDYIRHAEAVIFVLYYTHAFARADEAFLSQLAEVQNIVGVDKLFVVINAVDLATSGEEKTAVRERVVMELRRLGVAEPRIYEVSSQIAMASRRLAEGDDSPELRSMLLQRLRLGVEDTLPEPSVILEDSGVPALSEDLQAFLAHQSEVLLHSTAVSSFKSVERSLKSRVEDLRQLTQESEQMKRDREQRRLELAKELLQTVERANTGGYAQEEALLGEWRELSFHISERIRLSLSGVFRSVFHPSLFRSRTNPRRVLQQAASEFMEEVNRKIEAELRTFAMRIDLQVTSAVDRTRENLQNRVEQLRAGYLEVLPATELELGEFPVRSNLDAEILHPFFRYFSNPRQFFEEGGQKEMQAKALPAVMEAVTKAVNELVHDVEQSRTAEFRQRVGEMYAQTAGKLRELTDESLDAPSTLIQYSQTLQWFDETLRDLTDVG